MTMTDGVNEILSDASDDQNNHKPTRYSRDWEKVGEQSCRYKTPKGWIFILGDALCFIPDPNHEWILEDE